MADKSLIDANHYLDDPDHYEQFLVINTGSSAAIELGRLSPAIRRALRTTSTKPHTKPRS